MCCKKNCEKFWTHKVRVVYWTHLHATCVARKIVRNFHNANATQRHALFTGRTCTPHGIWESWKYLQKCSLVGVVNFVKLAKMNLFFFFARASKWQKCFLFGSPASERRKQNCDLARKMVQPRLLDPSLNPSSVALYRNSVNEVAPVPEISGGLHFKMKVFWSRAQEVLLNIFYLTKTDKLSLWIYL